MASDDPSRILVKLPVKLGDTIMAAYFLRAVKEIYPKSKLDVIIAKGMTELLSFMPYVDENYEFSKEEYSGPSGNIKYGRFIASKGKYDLFFCLPFSFSSALTGFFTRSKARIGYKREQRGFLFTKSVKRPSNLHIVEEFNYLLEVYSGREVEFAPLNFQPQERTSIDVDGKFLILNIRSGPPSRSIPVNKAISIIKSLLDNYSFQIVLTGAPNEVDYISRVMKDFVNDPKVINLAGKTSLSELFYVISKAECMITSDSGNAHVANAVGTPTVVLFGAAHPHRARPYDQSISKILKLDDLECIPCESEYCKFNDNRCLSNIENRTITGAVDRLLQL